MPRRARVSWTTWANSARSRKLLSPRTGAAPASGGASAAATALADEGAGTTGVRTGAAAKVAGAGSGVTLASILFVPTFPGSLSSDALPGLSS